jgi:hypothetical protein
MQRSSLYRAAWVGSVITVGACTDSGTWDSPYCAERALGADAPAELWRAEDPPALGAADFEPVPLRLTLPLAPGTTTTVAQGMDTDLTHQGAQRFALDFDVPLGTPVHAAAGGTVISAISGRTGWGLGPEWRNEANRVVIDHGHGLFSAYVHLDADGVAVMLGERVDPGMLLGWTGLSGQMSGPHLHFHVENAWSRTLPFRFFDPASGTCDRLLAEGETIITTAPESFDHPHLSEAPTKLFEGFGLQELQGFPARLFRRGKRYDVAGRATPGATEVVFMLLPEAGGAAVDGQRFAVDGDGHFQGVLTVEAPPGEYGWALVASDGGAVAVDRSVRCAVVDP